MCHFEICFVCTRIVKVICGGEGSFALQGVLSECLARLQREWPRLDFRCSVIFGAKCCGQICTTIELFVGLTASLLVRLRLHHSLGRFTSFSSHAMIAAN